MKLLWLLLLVPLFAAAQTLPDVPTPQRQQCGSVPCWDYSEPHWTNMQTLKSKRFVIPLGVIVASDIADRIYSVQVIHNTSCVEGNSNLPLKPTYSDMFKNWGAEVGGEAMLAGMNFMLIKTGHKAFSYMWAGEAGYAAFIHLKAIHNGFACRR